MLKSMRHKTELGGRRILIAAFVALLLMMLVAGYDSLSAQKRVQAEIANLRAERRAKVAAVIVIRRSTWLYSREVERLTDYRAPTTSPPAISSVKRFSLDVDAALTRYPTPSSGEEDDLLTRLRAELGEHRQTIDSGQCPSPASLAELTATVERLQELDARVTEDADSQLAQKLSQLQRRGTTFLLFSLGAGLLIALGSLAYILRLEANARVHLEQILRHRSELQELSARIVEAQEQERRSLSRELHDEVGQSLGALLVDTGRLASLVPPGEDSMRPLLNGIRERAEQLLREVRDISLLLRPSMLDDLGLIPALEWLARETSRQGGPEVEVVDENVSDDLNEDYRTCVYRLVQEALRNANRHSGARNVIVAVRQREGRILVEVRDDGKGFDPSRMRGMGLLGMEERVQRFGGALRIESQPGGGTTVAADLPLRQH
ncbi:MAG: sensor histidine kinase [Bryobacterales bacterium]|nr:sensor histidine kinase [Bryobacterales bacterium]